MRASVSSLACWNTSRRRGPHGLVKRRFPGRAGAIGGRTRTSADLRGLPAWHRDTRRRDVGHLAAPGRSEERRVGKGVDLGGRRMIKKNIDRREDEGWVVYSSAE